MNNKLDLLFEGGESSITIGQLHQNISESLKRNGFVDVIDDQVVVLVALVLEELDEGETGKITRERMERKIGECEKFRKLLDFLDDEGGVAVNVEGGLNSPLVEIPSDGEEEEGGKGKEKEKVIEIEMENVKVDETTYSKGLIEFSFLRPSLFCFCFLFFVCFVLFCFVLFCFVLFCFVLFCFVFSKRFF